MKGDGLLLRALTGTVLAALAGCYEIEPRLPEGYLGSPAEPGWPPPAVYDPDPFHPANRLFQRLFVLGVEDAAAARPPRSADLPISPRKDFGPADRAEVGALLGALERGLPGSSFPLDPAARALLASDLLWVSGRILSWGEGGTGTSPAAGPPGSADGPARPAEEVSRLLARAALSLASTEPLPASVLPPPLREEGWMEVEGPFAPELRPSLADLRWTRVFRRKGESPGTAVLRLRIAADAAGGPVLLPLGSEAWVFGRGEGGVSVGRVFHLRRAKLFRGEEPWEEAAAEGDLVDRGGAAVGRPEGAPETAAQADDARRALEAIFSKGR